MLQSTPCMLCRLMLHAYRCTKEWKASCAVWTLRPNLSFCDICRQYVLGWVSSNLALSCQLESMKVLDCLNELVVDQRRSRTLLVRQRECSSSVSNPLLKHEELWCSSHAQNYGQFVQHWIKLSCNRPASLQQSEQFYLKCDLNEWCHGVSSPHLMSDWFVFVY